MRVLVLAVLLSSFRAAQAQGVRVEGRVIDAVTGSPLSDIAVNVSGRQENPPGRAITDATGRFRFEGIQSQHFGVRVYYRGYVSDAVTFDRGTTEDVTGIELVA